MELYRFRDILGIYWGYTKLFIVEDVYKYISKYLYSFEQYILFENELKQVKISNFSTVPPQNVRFLANTFVISFVICHLVCHLHT